MKLSKLTDRAARIGLPALFAAGAVAAGAPAVASASVSSNWAGYVALPATAAHFSSVSGTWREPTATCTAGRESSSAVWAGLGGYNERSPALEQIGTDADCSRAGTPSYSAWYELIPAGPVNLRIVIHPGDEVTASATVRAHDATLAIRDLTTGAHFQVTRRVAAVDVSSAEWIVEAPSLCTASDDCSTLALTDFGSVAFSAATATAAGHTGPVADPAWSSDLIELHQEGAAVPLARSRRRGPLEHQLLTAVPSPLTQASGAFTVSWQEQPLAQEQPQGTTLPGFGGGPP